MNTAFDGIRRPGAAGPTLASARTITARNLRRLTRVPTQLALATVQPVLMVVLFSYAFGGAIRTPGVSRYIDYLLPGLIILAIGFGASQTGVAVAEDLATGMIDRFRSLPIAGRLGASRPGRRRRRPQPVRGRADDRRRHGDRLPVPCGPGRGPGRGCPGGGDRIAFSWLNLLLGLLVHDAETARLAGLFPVIILTFTSSTLVPVATMPGWLQAFAKINPITSIVEALRALCLGGPTAGSASQALAWIAGLLLVTVPTAVIRYRRATAA